MQTIPVDRLGDYSASADGACRVKFWGSIIGFVKPRADAGTQVVANEKIASDLGFLLGLPVAPVVVRTPQDGTEWDRYTALSLACFPSARHWCEAGPGVTDETIPALESLRVFWSWLGDTDHNQHPNNLLFEIDSGSRVSLLAIDHSYLLGQGQDPLTMPACDGYDSAAHAGAQPIRLAAIEKIEQLDTRQVQLVVERLVGTVLTSDQANSTLTWLTDRRAHLRQLF